MKTKSRRYSNRSYGTSNGHSRRFSKPVKASNFTVAFTDGNGAVTKPLGFNLMTERDAIDNFDRLTDKAERRGSKGFNETWGYAVVEVIVSSI